MLTVRETLLLAVATAALLGHVAWSVAWSKSRPADAASVRHAMILAIAESEEKDVDRAATGCRFFNALTAPLAVEMGEQNERDILRDVYVRCAVLKAR